MDGHLEGREGLAVGEIVADLLAEVVLQVLEFLADATSVGPGLYVELEPLMGDGSEVVQVSH